MHLLSFITLFSSCVSTFALPPLITPAPRIAKRQTAENICGYYSLDGLIHTISCAIGTACLVATNLSPAVGYCPGVVNVPVTTIYQWGDWPSDEGCGPGSACCPSATPDVGKYLFNSGETIILGCSLAPFTYTAFVSAEASTPVASQTPASAAATTTYLPDSSTGLASSISSAPVSDITTTPVTPLPSPTTTSSSLSSTTTTTVIVVGAVVALVGGSVFLGFLFMIWKTHQAHKYPQPQNLPLLPQNSTASLHSAGPVKVEKGGLSKWAKIVTVISPVFAIVGLAVSIYFGLKQQK